MDNLTIEAAKDTLGVVCDAQSGVIDMSGISYPQDAAEFFNPVFDWLDSYIEQLRTPLTLNLRINYLNTSSTKCLFDLIDKMESYFKAGGDVRIHWYYKADDEDIKETGLEFKEEMVLPFEIIPY
ncbi:MAG: DUF1987 domain-containing protein [Gammaproteobacteria bacterium]